MGQCSIDHSQEDVIQKLESQRDFLSAALYEEVQLYLKNEHVQEALNELFHILKKYDLASKEEQEERNQKLVYLINSNK
ncbi:group-specific protein [Domibacillus mangrovi]|uniref:Group-specific protein n=1 Tax=Domibacillus mangrovi TaxID=1714354 RepID=A0A1Q5P5U0_9BACI|nr:group-specific protein [Domibacillus mangrovi]OKL37462.1 group-specific protein [Domibacillus mangrovi]